MHVDAIFRDAWARIDTEREGFIEDNDISAFLRSVGITPTRQIVVNIVSCIGQTDAAHADAGLIYFAELRHW
jgi:Ca2+-binding EF-hand superfamily protein